MIDVKACNNILLTKYFDTNVNRKNLSKNTSLLMKYSDTLISLYHNDRYYF